MTKRTTQLLLQEYSEYLKFVEDSTVNDSSECVTHVHHKIPKCLGGQDEKLNLVRLSVEHHIKAHLLLAKCFDKGQYEYLNNIRSANLIDKNSIRTIEEMQEFRDSYKGKNNPFYGKTHSQETVDRINATKRKNKTTHKDKTYAQIYADPAAAKAKRQSGVKEDWANMQKEALQQRKDAIKAGLQKLGKEELQKRGRNAAIKGKGFVWLIDGSEYVTKKDAEKVFSKSFKMILKENEVSKKCV